MGGEYAAKSGEPAEVAKAIAEIYKPRFAGDTIPVSPVGQAVAIADKLDTLAGIFGIGQGPTGDKDPYALRRTALGVLRIVIEGKLSLDIRRLIQEALKGYNGRLDAIQAAVVQLGFVPVGGMVGRGDDDAAHVLRRKGQLVVGERAF